MTFKPSVQSFVGPNTSHIIGDQCAIDWTAQKVYLISSGLYGGYLTRFGYSSGIQEAFATVSAYSPSALIDTPLGLDTQGNLYLVDPPANFGGVRQINPKTLASSAQFGVASAFDNYPLGIPRPGRFAGVRKGESPLMISAGLGGSFEEANRLSFLTAAPLGIGGPEIPLPTTSISVFPGAPGTGIGYALCTAYDGGNGLLYKVDAQGAVATLIAPITPTQIDPTWTKCVPNGGCFDQTDGNILAYFEGQVGADIPFYTAKINATSGAIMWAVPFGSNECADQLPFSRIQHGKFCTFNFGVVTVIDTLSGAYTQFSEGLDGLSNGAQCFDDTSGAIIMVGSYNNEGSGSPTPLNATPDSFSGWMALYVIEAFVPPYVPGGRVAHFRIWGDYP